MKLSFKKRLKAQTTLLMILGLMILILVSFMLFLMGSAVKKQTAKETIQSQQTRMNVQPVIEYVNQCLDKVSREGLEILGKQGGYIFESQGGLEENWDSAVYEEVTFFYNGFDVVPYNIRRGGETFTLPDYPWPEFPYYPDYASGATQYTDPAGGSFGISIQQELLRKDTGEDSIQANLEAYVKNNTVNCTSFAIFGPQGYNITNSSGSIYINATIGENDVGFRLHYPLQIEYSGEKTIIEDFFIRKDVRLKKVYEKFLEIIEYDTDDISYTITLTSPTDGIEILVTPRLNNDDLIKIIDTNSNILGNDFTFQFGRRNRAPALHYIDDSTAITLSDDHTDIAPFLTDLNSYLDASDPDEDGFYFGITDQSGGSLMDDLPLGAGTHTIRVNVTDGNFTDYQDINVVIS